MSARIVAWDNLTIQDYHGGLCHAFAELNSQRRDTDNAYYRACDLTDSPDGYGAICLWRGNLREGGRLQTHVPELPLCPACAKLAGLRFIGP